MPLGHQLDSDFRKVLESDTFTPADVQKIIDDINALAPLSPYVQAIVNRLTTGLAAFQGGGSAADMKAIVRQAYIDMQHQPE